MLGCTPLRAARRLAGVARSGLVSFSAMFMSYLLFMRFVSLASGGRRGGMPAHRVLRTAFAVLRPWCAKRHCRKVLTATTLGKGNRRPGRPLGSAGGAQTAFLGVRGLRQLNLRRGARTARTTARCSKHQAPKAPPTLFRGAGAGRDSRCKLLSANGLCANTGCVNLGKLGAWFAGRCFPERLQVERPGTERNHESDELREYRSLPLIIRHFSCGCHIGSRLPCWHRPSVAMRPVARKSATGAHRRPPP